MEEVGHLDFGSSAVVCVLAQHQKKHASSVSSDVSHSAGVRGQGWVAGGKEALRFDVVGTRRNCTGWANQRKLTGAGKSRKVVSAFCDMPSSCPLEGTSIHETVGFLAKLPLLVQFSFSLAITAKGKDIDGAAELKKSPCRFLFGTGCGRARGTDWLLRVDRRGAAICCLHQFSSWAVTDGLSCSLLQVPSFLPDCACRSL